LRWTIERHASHAVQSRQDLMARVPSVRTDGSPILNISPVSHVRQAKLASQGTVISVAQEHNQMQDERHVKGVMPARTAPVGACAWTVSRLGSILQMASRGGGVLLAIVRTGIARDALTVRTVSLAPGVYAHSVLPARLQSPAEPLVPTVLRAKLASVESVTSAQMEPSQTLTARAVFRAVMGLRVSMVAAVIVVRGHSRMQDERHAKGVMPARTAPVGVRARTVSRLVSYAKWHHVCGVCCWQKSEQWSHGMR
jgi:hypothetical protein